MRWTLALSSLLLAAGLQAADTRPDALSELRWLEGQWRGVGQADGGLSAAERRIDSFLGGKYIRVQGQSVYPKQDKNPQGEIHAELGIWSYDSARAAIVLREFDTLGFVGTYVLNKMASSANSWVLIAESLENVPKGWKARYVITRKGDNEYQEVLELDSNGSGFQPYVTNRFLKLPSASP